MTAGSSPASPYDVLIGSELTDGWVVEGRAPTNAGGTGGTFSVCFNLVNSKGATAFCKVLDYERAVSSPSPVAALQEMTADFQHEVASLDTCRDLRMRKVVLALESSTVSDPKYPMNLLSYIIFEPAIGDLRMVLPLQFIDGDLALRFGLLHDAALGVRELHQARIAHQDLKPSNVLAVRASVDTSPVGKIADLGRAIVSGRPHRFDGLDFPGDFGYAPPEYYYHYQPDGFDARRRGTDLYQLGSLIAFVLSGVTMSALLYSEVVPALRWDVWGGEYADVEPALRDATESAVDHVVAALPDWAAGQVEDLLLCLCDPDPSKRNAMTRGAVNDSRFSLGRVIAALDRLEKLAALKARDAA